MLERAKVRANIKQVSPGPSQAAANPCSDAAKQATTYSCADAAKDSPLKPHEGGHGSDTSLFSGCADQTEAEAFAEVYKYLSSIGWSPSKGKRDGTNKSASSSSSNVM